MDWLERLKIQAHDPERAVQNFALHNITDQHGKRCKPVANPVLTLEIIQEFEIKSRLNLPNDLRRIYMEVGDGGFGPGYGLNRLSSSKGDSSNRLETIEDFYLYFRDHGFEDYGRAWSKCLLPFCSYGCDGLGIIDLRDELIGFIQYELLEKEPIDNIIEWQNSSIKSWFEAWMDGEDLRGYSKSFWENHLDKLFLLHHPV